MDPEKLFWNLESNNATQFEDAKTILKDLFLQTKDPWLLNGMMDYYLKTNSTRIVEVLIKAQQPADIQIFDRLSIWIREQQNRVAGLTLFGFIVRKHPTWLYKVAKHRLIKDIFRLLQNEREIVPLMSALLCLIMLLPIIPQSSYQLFLADLFHVFGHLATWNSQNTINLNEYQLVHLQMGLQMFFQLLYGMYPCSFLNYLKDFFVKERGVIFQHTIKPLLETVRIHPLLITANTETEASSLRWKDVQPHDVVVDCAKLSLAIHQNCNNFDFNFAALKSLQETPNVPVYQTPTSFQNSTFQSLACGTLSGISSQVPSLLQQQQQKELLDFSKIDQVWSPHIAVLATPPPVPHTPTPGYNVPAYQGNTLLGISGSSPPEAAIEATPETTPLKDLGLKRSPSGKSHAARSLLHGHQSSLMRKEQSPLRFIKIENSIEGICTGTVEQEVSTTTTITTTTKSQRFIQMLNDRNVAATSTQPSTSIQSSSPLKLKNLSANTNLDSPVDCSREDDEVTELTSQQLGICSSSNVPNNSDTLQDISNECEDCDADSCNGGLQVPRRKMINFIVNRCIKRNRFPTYCHNDNSCYLSYGTSPADDQTKSMNTAAQQEIVAQAKLRRTNSWPKIGPNADINAEGDSIIDDIASNSNNFHQSNGMDSSSPSGEDVMSAATHFKKIQQKKDQQQQQLLASNLSSSFSVKTAQQKLQYNSFDKIAAVKHRNRQTPKKITSSTQTITQPVAYEMNLLELFGNFNKECRAFDGNKQPEEILNKFIECSIKTPSAARQDDNNKEQIQLLYLQLQYERYRREIHAERNRRLMGRSREKKTLELENEKLRDQLRTLEMENRALHQRENDSRRNFNELERNLLKDANEWKQNFQKISDSNKQYVEKLEKMQIQLKNEQECNQLVNTELKSLRGEIFDLKNELLQAQHQAELGAAYKQDLTKLETEFLIMGEIQIKCRDRFNEITNIRCRDQEFKSLQDTYKQELAELRTSFDEKTTQLESAKHRINELQNQLINKEIEFTEQKRLMKSVKDEYEEKFKALTTKYDIQKTILLQMEQKIVELLKNRIVAGLPVSSDSEKSDIANSIDRTSPLSTSLASSEGLGSVTEIYLNTASTSTTTSPQKQQQTSESRNYRLQQSSRSANIPRDIPTTSSGQHYSALNR